MKFFLTKKPKDTKELFLDFHGKCVKSVVLNDIELQPCAVFRGQRIALPLEHLKRNNTLTIEFSSLYRRTGTGMHHFKDPQDDVRSL